MMPRQQALPHGLTLPLHGLTLPLHGSLPSTLPACVGGTWVAAHPTCGVHCGTARLNHDAALPHCRRFTMVVDDGTIVSTDVEESPGDLKITSAAATLARL